MPGNFRMILDSVSVVLVLHEENFKVRKFPIIWELSLSSAIGIFRSSKNNFDRTPGDKLVVTSRTFCKNADSASYTVLLSRTDVFLVLGILTFKYRKVQFQ